MRELSLNVLDIAENSVKAGATLVHILLGETADTAWLSLPATDSYVVRTYSEVVTR